jgi:hypothetical protein
MLGSLLVVLCFAASPAPPRPEDEMEFLKQHLAAPDFDWWTKFAKASDANDQRGMEDLTRRQKSNAENVFIHTERLYCENPSGFESQLLSILDRVAKRLDELDKSRRYEHRVEYVISLKNPKDRQDRLKALDRMYQGTKIFSVAAEEVDTVKLKESRDAMEEARDVFDRVKDQENTAWCLYYIGRLEEKAGNHLNAAVALDKGIDQWVGAEMAKSANEYVWMVETRRTLIEAGFDPEKGSGNKGGAPGADEGVVARNTSNSFASGSAWKESPLKLKLDPKLEKLEKYVLPGFAGDNPFTWSQLQIDKTNPVGSFAEWFKPFDKTVTIVREGAAFLLDRDGDKKGDEKFTLTAKPVVVEVPKDPADRKSPAYGIAVATGTQNDTQFGLKVSNVPSTEYALIRYRTGCFLEGTLEGQEILIIDDNDSGKFGDIVTVLDQVFPETPYPVSDAMVIGQSKEAVPFSEYVSLNGTFYRVKVSSDGSSVKTRALALDPGKVALKYEGPKPDSVVIQATGEFLGAAYDLTKAKEVDVPPGSYHLAYGVISNGKRGQAAQKVLMIQGDCAPFEVQSGKTHTLELGAPFKFDFKTKEEGDEFIVVGKSVHVVGKGGESYVKFYDDVPRPTVAIKTESGTPLGKAEEMKLGDLAVWQKGDRTQLYFPLDYSVKKRGSEKYLVQLTLKKHKILGGPISSDWK